MQHQHLGLIYHASQENIKWCNLNKYSSKKKSFPVNCDEITRIDGIHIICLPTIIAAKEYYFHTERLTYQKYLFTSLHS